jgi:carboxynorspermidine decarboxylase
VNPEYSTFETDLYNPASPTSRLGVRSVDLPIWPEGIEGLHFHSLCESRPEDLRGTLKAIEERFGHFFSQLKWVNFGGGHLMTHKDYDEQELIHILCDFKARYPHLRVILEPGSAFTWDTGCLVSTVEDKVHNGGVNTLMLNVSFACHMPDCLEMPYKPAILGAHDPIEGEKCWRMGGNSCLAGDFYGDWAFDGEYEPKVGDRIVFRDMIHYTMVKTTMFNGIGHPSIALLHTDDTIETLRSYQYEDYRDRMC